MPGEVVNGRVRKISVVPRPYQKPHPPLFQAFSVSDSTIVWCAREGVIPVIVIPGHQGCAASGGALSERGGVGRPQSEAGAGHLRRPIRFISHRDTNEALKVAETGLGRAFGITTSAATSASGRLSACPKTRPSGPRAR